MFLVVRVACGGLIRAGTQVLGEGEFSLCGQGTIRVGKDEEFPRIW